ncbi:MAG: hypothetical protein R3B06_17395 [Kofleriaceae bacterium]
MSSPVRTSARIRRLALVAVLCLVGQVVALFHLGLVRHVRCAAHGELVHADEVAVDDPVQATADQAPGDLAQLFNRSAAHGAEHEHCQLATDRTDVTVATALRVARPTATTEAVAVVRTAAVPVRALFRLAPKASPPTVG